ncbi:hypothetical protein [Pseudomonas sp. S2_H01]|jgi:predicted DNA binding CopG/RHH family protein
MSSDNDKIRVKFTEEEWLQIEIQAAAAGMEPKDYLSEVLKDAIDEIRDEQAASRTVH